MATGLDFRNLTELTRFCEHVVATYPRLDILINNAAQTVRRPPQYYSCLIALEQQAPAALPAGAGDLVVRRPTDVVTPALATTASPMLFALPSTQPAYFPPSPSPSQLKDDPFAHPVPPPSAVVETRRN